MSQPPEYERQEDFTDYQTNNPGQPMDGASLDNEFNAVKTTSDAIRDNLAILQRDDTAVANAIVHPDAFTTASLALMASDWVPTGLWVTATDYTIGDIVEISGASYVAATDHTSGAFATDHAAGDWVVLSYNNAAFGNSTSITETTIATAGQTVFPISTFEYIPGAGALQVHINGLLTTDFTETSGTEFTLGTGATLNDEVVVVGDIGKSFAAAETWAINPEDTPIPSAAGGDGATTYSALHWAAKAAAVSTAAATLDIFEFTATAGQTTVTGTDDNANLLAYIPDSLTVSINGATLKSDDFTATNGTSIVVAAMTAGDILQVMAFSAFALIDTYTKAEIDGGTAITPDLGAGSTVTGNMTINGQTVTPANLGYLSGVTSAIQTQLNAKLQSSDIGGTVQGYSANTPDVVMSQAEAEAGTSTAIRTTTAQRQAQAIASLAPSTAGSSLAHLGVLCQHNNLTSVNNSSNPTYQVDVAADGLLLEDVSGNVKKITSLSQTIDLTVSGAGGLDTGSEATSTWYHKWALAKADGTKTVVWSVETAFASVTLPTDYLYGGYLGTYYNDSGGDLINIEQVNQFVTYTEKVEMLNGSVTFRDWTAINVTSFYPPTAVRVKGLMASVNGLGAGMSSFSDGSAADMIHGQSSIITYPNVISARSVGVFNLLYKATMYSISSDTTQILNASGWEY